MLLLYRRYILAGFLLLAFAGTPLLFKLEFVFDFEQFFPEGDEDLVYFQEFIESFEADDNFLLLAIPNKPSVFDTSFLRRFHQLSLDIRDLDQVLKVQSPTMLQYPVKTPFGYTSRPIIHRRNPEKLPQDSILLMQDPRFKYNLISEKGDALAIVIKTEDQIEMAASHLLMDSLRMTLSQHAFDDYHMLGRAYFQSDIVKLQGREILLIFTISGVLVVIILALLFRKWIGVAIALSGIGLGLLFFLEFLGLTGSKLNAMSAFYPVLMLIVGTSDIIHIMSKYVDELKKGLPKDEAMRITIKQIGTATLLTSLTTAVGFATLLTSKVFVIREFGINSAIGVLIAYITTICFSTCLLSLFRADQIIREDADKQSFWDQWIQRVYQYTLTHHRLISATTVIVLLLCGIGISQIQTNYQLAENLPKGADVTQDFKYFESEFAGFRPLEFAIETSNGDPANNYRVLQQVDALETYLLSLPEIRSVVSPATMYKSIAMINGSNQRSNYLFPTDETTFDTYKRLVDKSGLNEQAVLFSKDGNKTRISAKVADVGATRIKAQGQEIDQWIAQNIDGEVVQIRRTGTGLIIDKNSEYVRDSLLYGLGLAIAIVSILMGLLFRNIKMVFISLLPNVIPLLFAAAVLGYLGIDLEAGISIVFAIVFGIAVDDTIHFLSKYKLARAAGADVESALQVTFKETGKAIVFTTIILFFGFLTMLFSSHPPSVTIGLLIAVTLISALVFDLTILPVLIRKFIRSPLTK